MKRQLFLLFFLIATTLSGAAAAPEKITLHLKWFHQFQFAGYYAAEAKGFYADEGLEVEILPRTPGENYIAKVLENEGHYGVADSSLVLYRMEGKPVVLLASIFQHNPLVLYARKEAGIMGPEDLPGKRVMYEKDLDDAPIRAMFYQAGVKEERLVHKAMTFDNRDLIEGRTDAMSGYLTDQLFTFKQAGQEVTILDPRSYGIDFYGDNLFTTEKEIAAHPDRAERFLRASLKGWAYALEHKDEIIDLIMARYDGKRLGREHLAFEADATERLIAPKSVALGSTQLPRFRKIAETYGEMGYPQKPEALQGFLYQYRTERPLSLTVEEKLWLRDHPVLRVAIDRDWAPFEYVDDAGVHQGLAADYLREAGKLLGVSLQPATGFSWSETVDKMKNRELDLYSCVVKTPERQRYADFTRPYLSFPMVIAAREEVTYVKDMEELDGKTVAVVKGYVTHELLKTRHPDISLLVTNNIQEALEAVSSGKAFAYVGNLASTGYYLKKLGFTNVKVAGQTPYRFELAMAARNDWPLLAPILQKALDAISQEEKEAMIYDRWIRFKFEQEVDYTLLYKVLAGALLLLAAALFWNWTMAAEIRRRKKVESELRHSEDRFRMLSDLSNEIIAIMREGVVLDVNRATFHTLGYAREEIIGRPALDFVHPGFRELVRLNIQSDSETPYEFDMLKKDGTSIPVLSRAKMIHWRGERLRVAAFQDLSLQKEQQARLEEMVRIRTGELSRAKETLERHLHQLEQAHRIARIAFWQWEVAQDRFSVFQDETNIVGFREQNWTGSMREIKRRFHPEDRHMLEEKIRLALTLEKEQQDFDCRWYRDVDGELRTFRIYAVSEASGGKVERVSGAVQDVTEERAAEEEYNQRERLLIQQSKMAAMGEMIGAIAHQWRQPLNGLSLLLQDLLEAEQYGELNREYLQGSVDTGMKQILFMNDTIEDFRTFFKPSRHPERFDMARAAEMVLRLLAPQMGKQQITVRLETEGDAFPVNGFPGEFKQVVINLVNNARDAILQRAANGELAPGAGEILLTARNKNGSAILRVSDNGGGIPPPMLDRLFTPYTTTKGSQGTGIGLSLSRTILEKMGGSIRGENREEGAIFTISLPLEENNA